MMRIVPHLNKFHFVDINKNVYNLVRWAFQIISKPFLVHKEDTFDEINVLYMYHSVLNAAELQSGKLIMLILLNKFM